MHEVGIMESTLDLARRAAQDRGASRIHVLRMRVGAMSGVVPDALEFAFTVLTEGTIAADAELEIETVSPAAHCDRCGQDYPVSPAEYACPTCGLRSTRLVRGKEIELVSMEVS